MAGERPAAPLPARVLRGADADHGARVVPHARRIRRPRAARRRRPASSTSTSKATRASSPSPVYAEVFLKSVWYALLTTLLCLVLAYPLAALIARSAASVPQPAAAARDPAVLEQLPDPHLCVDDHPRTATRRSRAASTACSRCSAHEPVPLLFSSFAVLVCLVYVHLPFMVLPLYANLEKHDQALLDAAQDLGANALAALLAHHVPAVAARRLRRRRAGVHPGARHLRDPRHPGRPRRQPDRQRDQAAVPRDARLAVRQRAVDRADGRGARRSRPLPRGSAGAASARRRASGRPVRKRRVGPLAWPRRSRATRSSTCRSSSSSSTRSTTRG